MSVRWTWLAIGTALWAHPDAVLACSVCSAGEEEARSAFIWTTVLLSVLPPGMVGGLVWWLWRLHRRREQTDPPLGEKALQAHLNP